VPRRGLEPYWEEHKSILLPQVFLLQWYSPDIRRIVNDEGMPPGRIGHPGGTPLLGAKKKGPRSGSPVFFGAQKRT
jgi:hypothetical protein